MKKLLGIVVFAILLVIALNTVVFAGNTETLNEKNANEIIEMKENVKSKLEEYSAKYESDAFGLAGFILDSARIYSIPICFIGIVVGALDQYVLGTRRLDKKHKGFGIIMTFVTLLVICQVLPLIFTIVVMGWRG